MSAVLILDQDTAFGKLLAETVEHLAPELNVVLVDRLDTAEAMLLDTPPAFAVLVIVENPELVEGLNAVRRLVRLMSNTVAILLTTDDNLERSTSYYQAGVHLCIPKEHDLQLLAWQIVSLWKHARSDLKGRWLSILTSVVDEVQRVSSIQEVADIIVGAGQRLGFQRARLWLLSTDGQTLHGASQRGDEVLTDFLGFELALADSPYTQLVLESRETRYFHSQELGEWMLHRRFAEKGFKAPVGEWVHMPLWAGERCWGVLMLDNADIPYRLSQEQRDLLSLFSRQVAAALKHAHAIEVEHRQKVELDWLERLNSNANDLQQASTLTEVAELIVQGARQLGFERARLWLLAEDRQTLVGTTQLGNEGLNDFAGFPAAYRQSPYMRRVMEQLKPMFFHGEEHGPSYLYQRFAKNGYRQPVGDWVAIPLHTNDRCRGLLALDNFAAPRTLEPEERRYLVLFGLQASTALERARQSYERTWLEVLSLMAEEAQKALTVQDVAAVVVRRAQELGFERARLWRLSSDGQILIGVSEAGNTGLPTFDGLEIPYAASFFARVTPNQHEPAIFQGQQKGETYLLHHFAANGFQAAIGNWVNIPLWSNNRMLGLLTLDNVSQPRMLFPGQRDLLSLLGRQVVSALERARLYEEERRQRFERQWLTVLADVAEQAQHRVTVQAVAFVIVSGAQNLGFARARIWLLNPDQSELVCISQAGVEGLEQLIGFRIPLAESTYSQDILKSREPQILPERHDAPAFLDEALASSGFEPPLGRWVRIPLWNDDRCLGMLVLDNADQLREVNEEHRDLWSLFGRQAVAALERARLYEEERDRRSERDWLKHLTNVAEKTQQALTVKEVADILVRSAKHLGFGRARLWRLSDDRKHLIGFAEKGNQGLDEFVGFRLALSTSRYASTAVSDHEPQFFEGRNEGPSALDARFASEGFESPGGQWVDLGLWISQNRCWGVLSLDNAREKGELLPEQRSLIGLFGRQAAAALDRALRHENEARQRRELQAISLASQAFHWMTEKDSNLLWHTVLAAIAAPDGFDFGSSALFLAEAGGRRLRLYDCFDREHRNGIQSFETYLQQCSVEASDKLQAPPDASAWTLEVGAGATLGRVLAEGRWKVVGRADVSDMLSTAFIERFGERDYTLFPLSVGGRSLGLVTVAGPRFTERMAEVFDDQTLEHLDTLLHQTALSYAHMRQRRANERLIELTNEVMADLSHRSLKETLESICHTAMEITGADSVVVYALQSADEPYSYDLQHVAYAGLAQSPHLSRKPRKRGIGAHILRSGILVVEDVAAHTIEYDSHPISQHPYIQRENIQAFVGVAVRDRRKEEAVGVLFLDYRTPQQFTPFDQMQALAFASLAAIAITNVRAGQQALEAGERELRILRRTLEHALGANVTDGSERDLVHQLLSAARELVNQDDISIGLLLRKWGMSGSNGEPLEYRHKHYWDVGGSLRIAEPDSNVGTGLTGEVFRTAKTLRVDDVNQEPWKSLFVPGISQHTCSELDVPILQEIEGRPTGVFNIESQRTCAFTKTHEAMIERLARVTGLALANLWRQQQLHHMLQAIATLSTSDNREKSFEAIQTMVRSIAPDVSALTIWYRDPETRRIRLGSQFGVRGEQARAAKQAHEESVVGKVMQLHEPIWAPVVQDHPLLAGQFVRSQQITSVAAFPLHADDDFVGAMFFNYRTQASYGPSPRQFTSQERLLYPLIATIVAKGVRDALRLNIVSAERTLLQKERKRLHAALQITNAVGTTLNLGQVLRSILEEIHKLFPDLALYVLTFHPTEDALTFRQESLNYYPIHPDTFRDWQHVRLEGPGVAREAARQALRSGSVIALNIRNVEGDHRYVPLLSDTRSNICITLMSTERELLGVLGLESKQLNAFGDEDVTLLRGVARQMSLALERSRHADQLTFTTNVAVRTVWAADIAHDINKEVGRIRFQVDALRAEPALPDHWKQELVVIDKAAAQLASTFRNARNESGQQLERIPIDEWVRRTVTDLFDEPGFEPIFDLRCDSRQVWGKPAALRRVFVHLIRNAREAMADEGRIFIRSRGAGWRVEVQVEDSGPGVSEQLRQQVFQRSFTTKSRAGGLGLMFIRMMIEEMGGTIHLLPSQPGRGAIFALTLPFASMRSDTED